MILTNSVIFLIFYLFLVDYLDCCWVWTPQRKFLQWAWSCFCRCGMYCHQFKFRSFNFSLSKLICHVCYKTTMFLFFLCLTIELQWPLWQKGFCINMKTNWMVMFNFGSIPVWNILFFGEDGPIFLVKFLCTCSGKVIKQIALHWKSSEPW